MNPMVRVSPLADYRVVDPLGLCILEGLLDGLELRGQLYGVFRIV